MASPEVETKTKVKQETKTRQKTYYKETTRTGDPMSRRDEEFEDPPMYSLMLLGDDGYDKEHVVLRMCSILEDIDEDRALEVFQQAQSRGQAMAGIYPFEKAELYKEQLIRSTPMIYADMVEDKN
jgi:ATP-dependent Clp protease adapter protein ClpS